MLRPGDIVSERYRVFEKLAAGGMGTVWRARHLELDVDVALKVLSSKNDDPRALERFRREAKAAARLRSPHIVQVLDYGTFGDQPFLVMELLRGEDLAARIAREGRLAPERCVAIVEQIARAVQLAHEAGVLHRDLKPANVFLESVGGDEVVKVLDFGVAKEVHVVGAKRTSTDGLVGSPAYMSPEQVWGQEARFASDVWALGVIAFEALTGSHPFDDVTLAKVFERIVRDPLPSAQKHAPDLPQTVDRFFLRAFARDPDERIASPRELARELAVALDPGAPTSHVLARAFDGGARASTVLQPLDASSAEAGAPERAARWRRAALWLAALALVALPLSLGALSSSLGELWIGSAGSGPIPGANERTRGPGSAADATPAQSVETESGGLARRDAGVAASRDAERTVAPRASEPAPATLEREGSAAGGGRRPAAHPSAGPAQPSSRPLRNAPDRRSSRSSGAGGGPATRLDPRFGIPVAE